jgi:hypothetical protein
MRYSQTWTTIRTEGALLPADFLQRLAAGKGVEGLSASDYGLDPGEKLTEAASRAWNRLQVAWETFQKTTASLPSTDPATTPTRERWLLPLFDALGYGRLATAKAIEIDGKAYPVSHGWGPVPIHLVGRNVDLGTRTAGVAGAARTSPHGLVQELLNRSPEHLWGFVSNGLKLRILRDNRSLTRQAYVEFDLLAIMDGGLYSDFSQLFRLVHISRVAAEKPEECWLEKWTRTAQQDGTRALERLSDQVEEAIARLGTGFLSSAAGNADLKARLRSGALDKQDYFRQILRLVYRLLFLFVAEDRGLLHPTDAAATARQRYQHYSTRRLRSLAESRRGSAHGDLWQSLRLVMSKLAEGCPELGLPALGSYLWRDAQAIPDLAASRLANADLLAAVRSLAFTMDGRLRRAVDFRNLGPEELGSVYESLLELHPEIHPEAGTFDLKSAAGSERKTTGSYYTPSSLIACLLDSALDPVLDEASKKPDPAHAILDLKVVDPACGSGHFLIAAAHRMANRLAAVRTGEPEPPPEAVRTALRDVIGHCIHGVDLNPMAAELCKINLWLETLEPGKPLSFLDHHIQVGNSLLGTTPALLVAGVPDEAFDPMEGDDKEIARSLKKQNKAERAKQSTLFTAFAGATEEAVAHICQGAALLEALQDDSLAAVETKAGAWRTLLESPEARRARLVADAWTAAFVWPKTKVMAGVAAPTNEMIRRAQADALAIPEPTGREVKRLAAEYGFLHWHLAFPRAFASDGATADGPQAAGPGWTGGFDVVLGNPPWERIKLQEQEFFAERHPEIAAAANAAARGRLIRALPEIDPSLHVAFRAALRRSDGESLLVRQTGRYPLCGRGDVNTYAVFAELNRTLLAAKGRAGFIVPIGIATDDTTKLFFGDLVESRALAALHGFENEDRLFPAVHHAFKFCLLTISGRAGLLEPASFVFFARRVEDLADRTRGFELSASDIRLLNPNTRTCATFRTSRDAELTKAIYRRVAVLIDENKPDGNPWDVSFLRLLV